MFFPLHWWLSECWRLDGNVRAIEDAAFLCLSWRSLLRPGDLAFFVSDMDVHCQELQLFQGILCLRSGLDVEQLYSLNHEAVTKHCRDRDQGMLRFTTYGIKAK